MNDPALEAVFGSKSSGSTPLERARRSSETFVRSQHQLSRWQEGALGRVLSAFEALEQFGWETLRDLADRPATPLIRRGAQPNRALLDQIDALGIDEKKLFEVAKFSQSEVAALKAGRQVAFRKIERLAQSLALEPTKVGLEPSAGADEELGVRLRSMRNEATKLSPTTVMALTEAAWVIRTQNELSSRLGEVGLGNRFKAETDYGSFTTPPYRVGFRLAELTRQELGIGPKEPIPSMTQLLEDQLGIPVIYVDLPGAFAGATLSNGDARGIVVNGSGNNAHVWVRRMTMAHELGHYLWDPAARLNRLIVDRRVDIEANFTRADPVEQRANAFAVEFLAPRDAVADLFVKSADQRSAVEKIMETFGIGRAASIYHLSNRLHGLAIKPGQITVEDDAALMGREELSVALFDPLEVPTTRRGRFAILVARAVRARLISTDTGGALLGCSPDNTARALAWIDGLDTTKPVARPSDLSASVDRKL